MNTPVEVPVGPNNADAVLAAMPVADDVSMKGASPAARSIKAALAGLTGMSGAKFIVLVTDGAANCMDDAPDNESRFEVYDEGLPQAVADAHSQGVSTYVVGIVIKDVTSPAMQDGNPDDTNAHEKLNEVAIAGGVARPGAEKYYGAANQLELQAAFEQIVASTIPCTVDVPAQVGTNSVEVEVNGMSYGSTEVFDCATEDGWHFVDETYSQIELCGAACEGLQTSGQLAVHYYCT